MSPASSVWPKADTPPLRTGCTGRGALSAESGRRRWSDMEEEGVGEWMKEFSCDLEVKGQRDVAPGNREVGEEDLEPC